jgi:hypothetical protein
MPVTPAANAQQGPFIHESQFMLLMTNNAVFKEQQHNQKQEFFVVMV